MVDKQLEVWSKLYPSVAVMEEIKKMEESGIFKSKTVNGAAKHINRYLKMKEAELNVSMQ